MTDIELERRALALFEAMLEIEDDEREAWLFARTGEDQQLRRRVEAIIRADRINSVRTGAALDGLEDVPPPQRIGAYRITELIGSGGMGSVYAAERDAGDFEHSVAIKLIKPGVLTDPLVIRFSRERQILAKLTHPHIARLFDGGTTEDGQPYFVMEKVDGVPLMDWIAQHDPDEGQRLELFLQICDAAAYAHRNLVVHRDLTPSNILVERDGNAKLIDFGIARPDGEEVGMAAPDAAPLRAMTLTPGFAAPERLRGEAATTLSDVYSAGRMLARLIDKPRPTELQAVIAKAIADDPEQRYLSMEQFAEDIRRYRERRPVGAMPGAGTYRIRKWVERNRPLAALSALLVVVVCTGVGATAWNWYRAETARAQAEQRFGEVRSIARFMLFDLYDELEPVAGNTKALSRIADEARSYLERLGSGDDLSPGLRLEIARGYHRLSNVSGNPEGANLGRREDARTFLDRAIRELTALHRTYPARANYTQALAEAHYSDAILRFIAEEDNEGAIAAGERSAELYRRLLETEPGNREHRIGWLRSRLQAAKPLVWIDRGDEGIARLEALRREIEAYLADRPGDRAARRLLAGTNSQLGYSRAWHIDVEKPEFRTALPPLNRAITIYDGLIADGSATQGEDLQLAVIASLFERSLVLSDLDRWADAHADLERAERVADRFIARDADDLGALRRREALHSQKIFVLLGLGRKDDAIALARDLTMARAKRARDNPDNAGYARDGATARQAYADALRQAGRTADACRAYRETEAIWDEIASRWPLSSIDREFNLAPLEAEIEKCTRAT